MSYAKKIKEQQQQQLIELLKWFGNQSVLAKKMNVSKQAVHNWVARGRISAKCAIKAETITKGAFTKEQLRPDVLEWETK